LCKTKGEKGGKKGEKQQKIIFFFSVVQLAIFLLLQQPPWATTSTYCATNQQPTTTSCLGKLLPPSDSLHCIFLWLQHSMTTMFASIIANKTLSLGWASDKVNGLDSSPL